jgi:hypothetical protein
MSHFRLDFWRESVENAIAKRTPVTVGIGVLCDARFEDGPAIILAVDDKGVYGDPPETANDVCGKFHDTLPFAALGIAVSGTLSTCDAIVAEFCTQLETTISKRKKKKTKPFLRSDDLRIAIREARRYEYPLYFDDQLQALTGMSREEWLRETNPEKKRKGWVVARAAQLYFPSWIIVGGFIGKDWVLMKSSGATVTEMGAQNFAVGIGELEALSAQFPPSGRLYVGSAEPLACSRSDGCGSRHIPTCHWTTRFHVVARWKAHNAVEERL